MSRLKDDGINTIAVFINLNWSGGVLSWPRPNREAVQKTIEEAHMLGMHVYLRMEDPVFRTPEEWPRMESQFPQFVLEAAELAERSQVSLFAPLTEPNRWIGYKKADEWMQQMLPAVRDRYKGKLVYQVDVGKDWDMNFKGYDYIAIDYYAPRGRKLDLASFRLELGSHIDKALGYANRDGLDGVLIGETAVMSKKPEQPTGSGQPFPSVTESEQAEYIHALVQEAKGKTKGVFYFGWNHPLTGIKDTPAEQALKDEYTH